jgi:hypothetical protein
VAWIFASFALTACADRAPASDREPDGAAPGAPIMSARDSAGVRLVRARFADGDDGPLLVAADTLLDGGTSTAEDIVGLVAVQPLRDGSLVVFTQSGPALLRYPADGSPVQAIGRPGFGPGEFASRVTLLPWLPDTLLLWDAEVGRLSRVTAAGIGAELRVSYPLERLATVSGMLRDGTVIAATIEPPAEQAPGLTRAEGALLHFDATGALRDTLVRFRGPERVVQRAPDAGAGTHTPARAVNVPFGRATLWTVGLDGVLLLDTEGCQVERRDGAGALQLRLDIGCAVETVTDRDRAQFLAEVLATARTRADSTIRRRFVDEATFPPAKATASGLLTDAWGRIWVRRPVEAVGDDWRWLVFDDDGTPVSTLRLARRWRIAHIGARDLLAVSTDEDDAPPVVARFPLPAAVQRAP